MTRFKYYPLSQMIEDSETGKRYYGNRDVAFLLNKLADEIELLRGENNDL